MTDKTTLLPCPFCGGEAEVYSVDEGADYRPWYWYTAKCKNTSCCLLLAEFETEAEAIAAWNARAERRCMNICKEWAKTSFAGAETSFCCSECGAHYVDCESYYAGLADANEEQIRTNFCPNCGAKVVDE